MTWDFPLSVPAEDDAAAADSPRRRLPSAEEIREAEEPGAGFGAGRPDSAADGKPADAGGGVREGVGGGATRAVSASAAPAAAAPAAAASAAGPEDWC